MKVTSFYLFLAGKYGIKPEDILLVHDELDKPLGKISIKHGGSPRLFFLGFNDPHLILHMSA